MSDQEAGVTQRIIPGNPCPNCGHEVKLHTAHQGCTRCDCSHGVKVTTEVSAFLAGRSSRDAEVADLREQLAKAIEQKATLNRNWLTKWDAACVERDEAQATIEKVRDWNQKHGTLTLGEILSAPSSTVGNFRDDLKSREPRRSDVDFDGATGRGLGGNDQE